MSDRDYDLVLLGATGFTGGLVAEDLTRQLGASDLRWAIAGRNPDKLAAVRQRLEAIDAAGAPDGVEQVDVTDLVGLLDLTARTRALATTVGPYARHGELVVQACVRNGVDYVDITGEPAFVELLRSRYDRDAARQGVRIVNCCGFDSIPHDLGAQLAVEQLPDDAPIRLRGFVSMKGRFSGGTYASAINAIAGGDSLSFVPPDPGPGRKVGLLPRRISHEPAVDGWALPMPTIDPQVVLRSAAALSSYGPDFRYGHYMRVSTLPAAGGVLAGVGVAAGLARLGPTRALLDRLAPSSGEGPDETTRERSRFAVVLLGEADGERTRVEVSGGDPGYTETSRMLSEALRSLVEDTEALPDTAGVLTPATAFGPVLRERLQARGMRFEVVR